jgi:hypothetical protein
LLFLHKANKPARIFVNCILALLKKMGSASNITINEGTVKDLRWFTQCALSVNGTVRFLKSVHPQTEIFASLSALGGVLGNQVNTLPSEQ